MPPDDLPGDLRRPLDESVPTRLRPAVPPDATVPSPRRPEPPATRPPAASPEPATGPAPATTPEPATAAEPATTPEPDATTPEPATGPKPAAAAEPAETTAAAAATSTDVTRHAATGARARLARLSRVPARVGLAPVHASRHTARVLTRWSRSPSGRFGVPALLVTGLMAAALATGGLLVPVVVAADQVTATPTPTAPATGLPGAPGAPTGPPLLGPTGLPGQSAGPPASRAEALRGWAEQTSVRTGVPVIALQAYGYAELVVAQTHPSCQLSWTTLGAIGRVESNHGSTGGAQLQPDGRTDPPIVGLPLDGQGDRMLITDTDAGALDGDTTYDRAVGPMQFIPQTWSGEAVDATGDGVADVHNIHDAALAAANYLCRHGRDLTTPEGWWGAILAYNNVQSYAEAVFSTANEYGLQSRA